MKERVFAVVAEPISTGETRYTVEVNGMTDYLEGAHCRGGAHPYRHAAAGIG